MRLPLLVRRLGHAPGAATGHAAAPPATNTAASSAPTPGRPQAQLPPLPPAQPGRGAARAAQIPQAAPGLGSGSGTGVGLRSLDAVPVGSWATVSLLDAGYDAAAGLPYEGFVEGARHLHALPLALADPQADPKPAPGSDAADGEVKPGDDAAKQTPASDRPEVAKALHGASSEPLEAGGGGGGGGVPLDESNFPALGAAPTQAPAVPAQARRAARRGRAAAKSGAKQAPDQGAAGRLRSEQQPAAGAVGGNVQPKVELGLRVETLHGGASANPDVASGSRAAAGAAGSGAAEEASLEGAGGPRMRVQDWPVPAAWDQGPRALTGSGTRAGAPRSGTGSEARSPGAAARAGASAKGPARGPRTPSGESVLRPDGQGAASAVLHVGFEYESRDGRRFILAAEHVAGAARGAQGPGNCGLGCPPGHLGGSGARAVLTRDLLLLLDVPAGSGSAGPGSPAQVPPDGSSAPPDAVQAERDLRGDGADAGGTEWRAHLAQLMRVWVSTPEAPVSFAMQPTIHLKVKQKFQEDHSLLATSCGYNTGIRAVLCVQHLGRGATRHPVARHPDLTVSRRASEGPMQMACNAAFRDSSRVRAGQGRSPGGGVRRACRAAARAPGSAQPAAVLCSAGCVDKRLPSCRPPGPGAGPCWTGRPACAARAAPGSAWGDRRASVPCRQRCAS